MKSPKSTLLRRRGVLFGCVGVFLACSGVGLAQAQTAKEHGGSPLTLNQTGYRLRAGESTRIDAAPESLDFLLHAKIRRIEIAGTEARGIVVGPNRDGDQILVAASLTMKPGEYTLSLSATTQTGERRATTVSVIVDSLAPVPSNATQRPVILLNGWQLFNLTSSCPVGNDPFGSLPQSLIAAGVPVVYFFDNCSVCPNCTIEQLGSDLGQTINSIQYVNGEPVPQVDLIAHSMGGLIVRSYLAGQQTASGVFSPPNNSKVRKAVFVATPHFGSFLADNPVADVFFALGNQTNEMKPGSAFLWNLGTWNQWSDDIRGVDALAVIGNSSCCTLGSLFEPNGLANAGDGVVSLSSASLGFSRDQSRTRILKYCHTDEVPGCSGAGIADVTEAPETGSIILSFLANTSTWMSIGGTPSTDPYLSQYGGMLVADISSSDQYVTPSAVSWGTVALNQGGAGDLFYNDFVNGTATFNFGTSTCGPFTEPTGFYSAVRCKFAPTIYSVGPPLSGMGKAVQVGGTITIIGVGFGSQQCSGCQVVAAPPGATTGYILPVSSWTDQAISASFLPATMPNLTVPGLVTIYVVLSSSAWDSINIMAAPASSIAAAPSSLQFAYTVGGTIPAAQSVQITNSGGGTLVWSATAGASWLSVNAASGTAPSTLSVLASPGSLGAGTYTGSVQISAAGASNSPVSVTVTLTVAPAPPSLAVSPTALAFSYTVGSSVPVSQGISINNMGDGTLSWTASASAAWVALSPVSGTAPATLSVSVNPATLAAGQYSGTVQIVAAGVSNSPQTISVSLVVTAASTVPTITSVVNGASFQPGIESGSWVTIKGTNLATDTRIWQTSDFDGNNLPLALDGTSVTIDGKPAAVYYISPTQLNVQAPTDSTTGSVPVVVTNNRQVSAAFTAQLQTYSPAFFLYTGTDYAIAQRYPDNAIVGNPSVISGTVAAKPGDVLILWATGFGPTNPTTPAGIVVSGAPGVLTLPVVTVGGVPATVISAVLSPGSAGLYQVAIQLPASVPTGAVAIQASVGRVQSAGGIVTFVSAQ